MPYYISENQSDCDGWAAVKEEADGSYTTIGCHNTKQDAIDQMVAISISEDMEPGGEIAKRELPDNYRPALADDVPEGRACGNCYFYDESRVNAAGDKAWCEKWDEFVDGAYYCNAWHEDMTEAEHEAMHADDEPMLEEDRAPAPPLHQTQSRADYGDRGSCELVSAEVSYLSA